MTRFVDSSVVVRAFLSDEPHHELAHAVVFGEEPVLASELALLECEAAFRRGQRLGRIDLRMCDRLCDAVAAHLGADGPTTTLSSDLGVVVDRAREIVHDLPVRSLDALHLAVADIDGRRVAGEGGLVFVTADRAQAEAAVALGMSSMLLG